MANPGYLGWRAVPITGPRTVAPYDYDCNGVETLERTVIAMCLDATVAGWETAPPPECGAYKNWDTCDGTPSLGRQYCR